MKIFKDIICGDEVLSDSYKIETENDLVYVVEAKVIQKVEGQDNFDIGANPSAEEAVETMDSNTVSIINVVESNRLVETSFDKKSYMMYIKSYMKNLLEKLKEAKPERAASFQSKASVFVKKVLENFNDWQFFQGASMDPESMVILMKYGEDGLTPYFYYFIDGLEEEKV